MEEEIILTDKGVRKKMFCNHCMFDCENYSKMKEHYQSEFHKYNLNRVTMNLNPLNYSEYVKKKEQYEKRIDEMNKIKEEEEYKEKKCDICIKKFSNSQKYKEHIQSKAHIKMENEQKRSEKEKEKGNGNQQEVKLSKTEKEKTTKDDSSVCLFCNCKNQGIEKNVNHMVDKHQLDVPFLFCIRNYQKLVDLLSSKIFEHNACLTCNNQNFNSYRSLQNHMIDKAHTRINKEDLAEYLYKLYDMKKLLNIKDTNIRKMNEFKILSLRHKVALRIKENNEERKDANDYNCDDDEWEDLGNYNLNDKEAEEAKVQNESDLDYEPMRLPNGELLLEDGSVLGNKIYNIYYKQRIHISKYDTLQKSVREGFIAKRNQMKKFHRHNRKQKNIYNLKGSNKANFQRINNLFKLSPQV